MTNPALKIALLADASHVNIQRWTEGLVNAGADVRILSLTPGETSIVQVYPLRALARLPKLAYFTAAVQVRRLLRRIQPDILVAYYVTGYGTLATLSGFHPRVHVTSGSDVLLVPNLLIHALVRWNLRRADLITAWAPHMAEAALRLGVPETRLMTVPQGIPSGIFKKHRCARPDPAVPVRMISTRSLKASYRFDVLLEAARLLRESGTMFHLTIAGDGPQRGELAALAERYQLGDLVTFAGFVPNHDLPPLLAQHHLYVSMVPSDGVSASLLEAMSAGLYPVVPDHPANRLWIEADHNGTLLDDLRPETVARALHDAVDDVARRVNAWEQNPQIVSTRADLYHNSRIFVERFRQLAGLPGG
jgi:glycosyltransferase involved in cell wall biosynthesis